MRFSTVLIPVFRSSAKASGTAMFISFRHIGIAFVNGACSKNRRTVKIESVTQAPIPLPKTTAWHAFPGSLLAQKDRADSVVAIEHSCSATSTAASVLMRPAAVKYPVITPHRQLTGMTQASNRIAPTVCISPIQLTATTGAKQYRRMETVLLQRMLYNKHTDSMWRMFSGLSRPNSPAVKYMVAVRIPAMAAVIAIPPTESTSCKRPTPAAPIFPDMKT